MADEVAPTAEQVTPDDHRRALVVAGVGLAVYALLVVFGAATHGGNAEWFMKFGSTSTVTTFGRQVLGDDLIVPYDEAQDGTAFWIVARDPFLLDAGPVMAYTDRPAYRSDRVLYPALVAPFRVFGEQGLVWGLVLVNLAVVFGGGYLTTRLALLIRAPWRAGFAYAANPLVLAAVMLDLADALTVAALVGTVWAARRGRWGWAIGFAVAAGLSKESSLLAVAALAVGLTGAPVRRRVALAAVPALLLGCWAVYVRTRVATTSSQVEEITLVPFGGYSQAWRLGWSVQGTWGDAFVAGLLLVIAVVVVVRWWGRRTPELWAALPFALMAPFLSGQVLHWGMNSIRAIGPALTFLVLDIAAGRAHAARRARPPGQARPVRATAPSATPATGPSVT